MPHLPPSPLDDDTTDEAQPDADRPVPRWPPAEPDDWRERLARVLDGLGWSPLRAAVVGVALVVAALVAWLVLRPGPPPAELVLPAPSTTAATGPPTTAVASTTTEPAEVVVHAAGAVVRPGVYRLAPGARVADLVDAAGGFAPSADQARVNLAQALADGMRVYVVARGQEGPPTVAGPDGGGPATGSGAAGGGGGGATGGGLVNVNTATATELDTLHGVGPATASAIIEHRERVGPFTTVEDLLDVSGIGEATLADLRDHVTV